jgi:hypothetical protein
MGAWRRRVWIAAMARLRRSGVAPWLAFTCWIVFVTSQEPSVLRQSAVFLREPAAWTGACLLWSIFALQKSEEPSGALDRFASLGLLLLLTAAATSILLLSADLISNAEPSGWRPILGAGYYLAALAPVALAASLGLRPVYRPQNIHTQLFMTLSLGPAAAVLIAAPLAAGSRLLFAASGLSICASLLLMIAWERPRQPQLPGRRTT